MLMAYSGLPCSVNKSYGNRMEGGQNKSLGYLFPCLPIYWVVLWPCLSSPNYGHKLLWAAPLP